MLAEHDTQEILTVIPIPRVCAALGCTPKSLPSILERFETPLTALGPKKRGVRSDHYKTMLDKASQSINQDANP